MGDTVLSGAGADIKPGNALPIRNIPVGTLVHNIELKVGKGGQIARSAGSVAQILAKEGSYAHLRLASGEVRLVFIECMATIGQVGNVDHEKVSIGKAGRNRWKGVRPTVRGVVMNPVDHPHGGGEGRSSGGRHPCTPWGKPTKGYKTRLEGATGIRSADLPGRGHHPGPSGRDKIPRPLAHTSGPQSFQKERKYRLLRCIDR